MAINCGGFEGSPAAAIAPTQHGFCSGGPRHGQALPCGCYFSRSHLTITATDNAKPTNFGGVYGHTLTFSEPDSNNLAAFTAADPTGLLVATLVEGKPSELSVREYKGY